MNSSESSFEVGLYTIFQEQNTLCDKILIFLYILWQYNNGHVKPILLETGGKKDWNIKFARIHTNLESKYADFLLQNLENSHACNMWCDQAKSVGSRKYWF